MSPGKLQDVEQNKLRNISELCSCLLDLKQKQRKLEEERTIQLQTKCDMVKKMRIEEYKQKSNELGEKEKELCMKTNKIVDELVALCDDSPFHKSLIKTLGNMKGKSVVIVPRKYGYKYYS